MRPKRYPFSGKIKTSTTAAVKVWLDACSEFIAKTQTEQERAEQKLDDAILRVRRLETLTQQHASSNHRLFGL